MRRASARAAARGGLPNALFICSAAERLPPELTGATELHVIMPWGSLLRGIAGGEPGLLTRLAGACRPGARFLVVLNLHAWRPPVPEVGATPEPDPRTALVDLAAPYRRAGWRLERAAYLDDTEIDGLHSSWARRLRSSRRGRFDVLALSGTIRAKAPVPGGAGSPDR